MPSALRLPLSPAPRHLKAGRQKPRRGLRNFCRRELSRQRRDPQPCSTSPPALAAASLPEPPRQAELLTAAGAPSIRSHDLDGPMRPDDQKWMISSSLWTLPCQEAPSPLNDGHSYS
jgi:hypothetical protein